MTSRHILQYGTTAIHYELTYVERTTLAIHVHPDGRVRVEAPLGTEFALVEEKVRKRAAWIVRQLRNIERFSVDQPPREYVSGETHHYLGRQYRLKVLQSATRKEIVKMERGRILVYARDPQDRKHVGELLDGWYRKQAQRVFAERLDEWLPRFERYGIQRPEVVIRQMKSRWGSCTPAGKIMLNLRLIQQPKQSIDYVIVHELCHQVEHNHSPAFYALLRRVMPDWERRKERIGLYEL
jgi:predicted metal-dependent hydrolase